MAQLWKPGVLKANMPEHVLVRFTVANVMPGWDPKWLDELLLKTEETLRTAHPLVKAFGPFSPTKLDSSRLSMLMQGVASALVAAKKKEKGTSAKTTTKETAAPPPKKEEGVEREDGDKDEEEELDEEDEESDEEDGDSSGDDSDDDTAAKSPYWFVVRWLHLEQVAIFRELVQRKLLTPAKAKRRLDAMDLEGESIEGLREKVAERQRKLMDVVNDVLDAKAEREGGKRDCAVQMLSDVKDKAGRYLFEEIDRRMGKYFGFNINEYALRDSQDYEEEELREKVERLVESHGRKATLACPVHARNFRSLLEEWARVFGSDKVFEMLDGAMDEVEETVEEDALDGVRASTERRMDALVEKARKIQKEHDALVEELERGVKEDVARRPGTDSGRASSVPPSPPTAAEVGAAIASRAAKAAAAKMEGRQRSGPRNAEMQELVEDLMTMTYSTTLRELVRRGVMKQREAKDIIDRNDSESGGNPALYLPRLLFQFSEEAKDKKDPRRKKTGLKTMQERATVEEAQAFSASFNLYTEMRELGHAKLWEDVLRIVEQRLLLAITDDGLRPLGYQDCGLQSALRATFYLFHGNNTFDAALAAVIGMPIIKPAEQLMVLLEFLGELFDKKAMYAYVGGALGVVVTEVEEEAFGGPKALTAQIRASWELGALLEKAAAKDKKGKGGEKKKEKGKKKGGKKKEEVVGLDEETDAEAKMMAETFMEVYEGSLGEGGRGEGGGEAGKEERHPALEAEMRRILSAKKQKEERAGGAATEAKETKKGAAGGTPESGGLAPASAKKEESPATAAARKFGSDVEEEMNEVRVRRFVHVTELAYFREVVSRELMPQAVAQLLLEKIDEECHGLDQKKTYALCQMFRMMAEKGMDGKEELRKNPMSLEDWSIKRHIEVKWAAEERLLALVLMIVEEKMIDAVKRQGLRLLESEDEEESLEYVRLGLFENKRLDKVMSSMDGTNDFQVVRRLRALYSILVGPWGVDAVNDCMDNVMSALEDELEYEAFGGTGSRKKTVHDRWLVQEEKKKREEREKKKAAGRADAAAATKADAQAKADARTAARMRQRQEEEEEEARKRLQEQQGHERQVDRDAKPIAQAESKSVAGKSEKPKTAAAAENEDGEDEFKEEEEDLLEWMKHSAQVALEETRRKKEGTTLPPPPAMESGRGLFRTNREGAAAAGGGGSKVAPPVRGEVVSTRPSIDGRRERSAAFAAAAAAVVAAGSGRPEPLLSSDGLMGSTGEAASGSPTEGGTKKKKKKKKTKKKKKQGAAGAGFAMGGAADGDGGGEEEEDEDEDEDEADARILALVRAAVPVTVAPPAPAPAAASAPPVAVAVPPAAQAAAAGSGGGEGGGSRPGTVAGRAAAAMVARAQAAAAAKQKKEEEAQREGEGGGSSDEDEVFAASLKATAASLGKLNKVEGAQGGGAKKKGGSPPPPPKVFNEENIPSEYVCPISFGIMYEPVIATDGHSYERAAIEEWIETRLRKGQPITSPFTNDLMDRNLIPNRALRNLIRAFCVEHSLPIPTGPAVYSMG